jgi:YD repeat-containing protein
MNHSSIQSWFAAAIAALGAGAAIGCSEPQPSVSEDRSAITDAPAHPCPAHLGAKPWEGAVDGLSPCTGNLALSFSVGPIEVIYNSLDAATQGPAGFGTRLGVTDRLVVDAGGAVTRVLPGGEQVRFAPDGHGGFVSPVETDAALTQPSSGEYDLRLVGGTRLIYTRPNGHAWVATAIRDRIGNTTAIQVDAGDRETAIVDPVGRTTTLTWSGSRLAQVHDAEGAGWTLGYDAAGQLMTIRGPDGAAAPGETIAYDGAGHHLIVGRSSTAGTQIGGYTYAIDGSLTAWTDPHGRTTRVTSYPHEVIVTDPFGAATTYQFTLAGEIARAIDPTGAATSYTYDVQHRVAATTDWLGGVTAYAYDAGNNVTRVTDRYGKATAYTYANHNVLTETDATARTTAYTYDANDQVLSAVDPSHRRTTYNRAANGNLLSVVGSDGTTLEAYSYGAHGEVLTATDADGRITRYSYDGHLNPTSTTTPDGLSTAFQSTALGTLLSTTSPAGETRRWSYDPASRLTGVDYEDGMSTALMLDADGRPVQVVDRGQRWNGSYAPDGRIAATAMNGVADQVGPAAVAAPSAPACARATCAAFIGQCGMLSDGCGGTLSCTCGGPGSGSGSGSGGVP